MSNIIPNQAVYSTAMNNIPCPDPYMNYCEPPTTKNILINTPKDSQRYGLSVEFTDPALTNLKGSITIDPNCPQNILKISGGLNGFANLANIKVINTSTADVSVTAVPISTGNIEYQIKTIVPVRVNGITPNFPINTNSLNKGWNFRTPLPDEIPANNVPVEVFSGSGTTGGDIYFTANLNNFVLTNAQIPLTINTTSGNSSSGSINYLSSDTLNFVANSSVLSILSNDSSNTISFGLLLNSSSGYNDLSVNNGLLSYHIPRFVDTFANTNITILDTENTFTILPLGSVAYWKNNNLPLPVPVRKIAISGSNQWQILSNSISPTSTSTLVLNLSPTNVLTGSVPLRYANGSTGAISTLSLPAVSGTGYNLRTISPLTLTDAGNGELQFGLNTGLLFTPVDTSTADIDFTAGNLSVSTRLRANGATVPVPAGTSPVGYDIQTDSNSLLTLTTGTGSIQFGDKLNFQNTNSVSFTRTNSPSTVTVSATSRKGYNTAVLNSDVTGNLSITSSGADLIYLSPSGNLTANRIFTLLTTGAIVGDIVTISTLDVDPAEVASFNYIVNSNAGFLAIVGNEKTLVPNSSYNFMYIEVSTNVFEWRHIS